MAHEIEPEQGETIWSAVAVVVLAAASWALLFVGLVSFGPGSVPLAALVFFTGGVGFVLAPFVPFTTRERAVVAVVMAAGAVAFGVVSVAYTPPGDAHMRAELDDAVREFTSLTTIWVSAGQSGAPWEAPVASGGGTVRDDGNSPLDTVVAGLERRGWAVEVLRSEADGLENWLATERGSISWDLAARSARYEMRAALSESDVHVRLAWHPMIRTYDPFTARSLPSFLLWLGPVAMSTIGAALAGMVGIVLALVSIGLAVARAVAALRD